MGILGWFNNIEPEGSVEERIKRYGLDRIKGLNLELQKSSANSIGKFEKGRLGWLRGAKKHEKHLIFQWGRLICRGIQVVQMDNAEFHSEEQLPCSKDGAELALVAFVIFNALEGDKEGEKTAIDTYYSLATFVNVMDVVSPVLMASGDEGRTVSCVVETLESWRGNRVREHARLTTKFQQFMSAR